MRKQHKQKALNFELVVDGKALDVTAKPYSAAHAFPRFRVSYNGSPVHIFGLDPEVGKIVVLDSASAEITPRIEYAIGTALQTAIAA